MVFDDTPLTPTLTLTMVFLLRIFKICNENGQINIKYSVLGDLPPSIVKDHNFAF